MLERVYLICLRTPLCLKRGIMRVERSDNVLSGELELMGHCKPFYGIADETGGCSIAGTIITLMRTVPYTASGTIEEGTIRLRVKDEKNTFELSGTVCEEEGED